MRLVSFVPVGTKINFLSCRKLGLFLSVILCIGSSILFFSRGLNYGIDFEGGILIEVRTSQNADISDMRARLSGLGLGQVELQEFGRPTDVLIRVERQSGDADAQNRAVEKVRATLGNTVDYRRVEFVGPKVSSELVEAGVTAVLLALAAMLLYIWFRFEWQFGVGAVVALIHDVVLTIGIFSLLGLEFNLSTVAAILTIAGYSINDTVVVYDRVRENLRKFKVMDLIELLNLSLNDTLSRTLLTSITTLLALGILYTFGGEVLKGFSFAMIWGVLVGTYSSLMVATPLLVQMNLRRVAFENNDDGSV
ncbi:MAG: protein translocase subunit SecF [Rhodospirillaceae bacterium]|nr:protein translocase subunit SecF [Rhodospirillaceae bacterium]|tara:strand:- start:820 stop:1743 length:924 start_codon:yes stop_codon:yes gene_type:complete